MSLSNVIAPGFEHGRRDNIVAVMYHTCLTRKSDANPMTGHFHKTRPPSSSLIMVDQSGAHLEDNCVHRHISNGLNPGHFLACAAMMSCLGSGT